ncbi:lipoprotein [Actinorhabdospora filicis]|uniref:Lipoprotein n=1 Tax=Actinorhabdospora filicis TaxID=1785913 RepID=A0A9W6SKG3_9ACTN|nr:DUF58 domain-containing protein [Actinorhabdospora filicis]GLZ76256.1 lipoprotein [Actinorhabdospora filicis]
MITWRPVAVLGALLLTLPLWPEPFLGLLAYIVLVGVACVADALIATPLNRVTMWRSGDRLVRLTGTATVTLHLRNDGTGTLYGAVHDTWVPSAGAALGAQNIVLPPGKIRDLPMPLTPTRRGDRAAVRVTLRSHGPMRLAYRQATRTQAERVSPPWTLRVLPRFDSRRHLAEKFSRLRVLEGAVAARGRGRGSEFDSLREYVIGDDIRSIDWRASARRESVIVKTWRPERDRRVLCVLDTGRTSAVLVGTGEHAEPRLDATIDAALLLSAVAARAGDRVDALAVDTDVRAVVEGGARRGLLPKLIRALAPLEPALVETDFGLVVAEVLRREQKRALVVIFTSLEPGAIAESLLPALPQLASRHKVIVAAVSDPVVSNLRTMRGYGDGDPMDVAYQAAAAEKALVERRRVAASLVRYGVDVVDAPSDVFASKVTDAYLALKASGRL